MEAIEKGFCRCGCGGRARIANQTHKTSGSIKGQPNKFIHGHNSKGELSPQWKTGHTINHDGYLMTRAPEHPRSRSHGGYVLDHILMAEKALGKPLPGGVEIHHYPQLSNFTHIIICQNRSYHRLIERRQIALKKCGHANWGKCVFCKQYDLPENLRSYGYSPHHQHCNNKYQKRWANKKKEG